jgi:hypothetical protein
MDCVLSILVFIVRITVIVVMSVAMRRKSCIVDSAVLDALITVATLLLLLLPLRQLQLLLLILILLLFDHSDGCSVGDSSPPLTQPPTSNLHNNDDDTLTML